MEERQQNDVNEFNRLYKEMDDLYHDIALKLGLSDSALTIFYAICELGDGCLQKDICSQSFCSKQTINSSIRKLEREGTVYLKRGKGKNMHIYLTERGREFVENKVRPAIGMEARVSGADAKGAGRASAPDREVPGTFSGAGAADVSPPGRKKTEFD